ncbi:hypothetical protein JHK87_012394 [Glycine soja]|nr:hypothetical protein JHK87_012394 [Glycine soja]
MKGLNNRFFTVGLVAAWYSSNIGVLQVPNLPDHVPHELRHHSMDEGRAFADPSIHGAISALSLIFCVSVVFGNISLCYLPMSFNQAIGATMPFFIAVFAYLMTLKSEAGLTYLTLVLVVTGVIIASGEQMARVAKEEERGSPSWGASFFTQTTQDVARAVAAAVNSQRPCVVYAFKNDHGGSQLQRLQRKLEITTLESVIAQSHEGLNRYKEERDKLHGERKSLWGKENELTAEIDKLRAEVEKAEKSLDHAIPGVIKQLDSTIEDAISGGKSGSMVMSALMHARARYSI